MKLLKKYILENGQFPDGDINGLLSYFTVRKFKKNEFLLEQDTVAKEVFFVNKGLLRQYFHNVEGDERTCNFILENDLITDLESFSKKTKSSTSIVALETSECAVVTCDDLIEAVQKFPGISTFLQNTLENIAMANIRRIRSFLSDSPEKQFDELLQTKPELLQRVPQRLIAQYIGIAPESLSRIRKRKLSNKKS